VSVDMADRIDTEKQATGRSEEREDTVSSQLETSNVYDEDNYQGLTLKTTLVYLVSQHAPLPITQSDHDRLYVFSMQHRWSTSLARAR
jgi:hypothetical protein